MEITPVWSCMKIQAVLLLPTIIGPAQGQLPAGRKGQSCIAETLHLFCSVLGHIWMHLANITVVHLLSFCKLILFLPPSLRDPFDKSMWLVVFITWIGINTFRLFCVEAMTCTTYLYDINWLHIAKVGSVAMWENSLNTKPWIVGRPHVPCSKTYMFEVIQITGYTSLHNFTILLWCYKLVCFQIYMLFTVVTSCGTWRCIIQKLPWTLLHFPFKCCNSVFIPEAQTKLKRLGHMDIPLPSLFLADILL